MHVHGGGPPVVRNDLEMPWQAWLVNHMINWKVDDTWAIIQKGLQVDSKELG